MLTTFNRLTRSPRQVSGRPPLRVSWLTAILSALIVGRASVWLSRSWRLKQLLSGRKKKRIRTDGRIYVAIILSKTGGYEHTCFDQLAQAHTFLITYWLGQGSQRESTGQPLGIYHLVDGKALPFLVDIVDQPDATARIQARKHHLARHMARYDRSNL